MFRKRPLTWLFVVATVAVDTVLLMSGNEAVLGLAMKTGFVLGQLAALAIWTVRGRSHRLTRISCLVIATGLLTSVMCPNPESMPTWIAFNSGYVLAIVLVAIGTHLFHYLAHKPSCTKTLAKPWQFPLVEFFGWTIVVAMISLGTRTMDFGFLNQTPILLVVALTAVPVAIAILARRDLRDLRGFKAIVCSAVVIATALTLGRMGAGGQWLVLAQAAYLAMWMAVLGMDDVLSYVTSVGNPSALSLLKIGVHEAKTTCQLESFGIVDPNDPNSKSCQSTRPNQAADSRPRLFNPQD